VAKTDLEVLGHGEHKDIPVAVVADAVERLANRGGGRKGLERRKRKTIKTLNQKDKPLIRPGWRPTIVL
jgi:hypothetical protein